MTIFFASGLRIPRTRTHNYAKVDKKKDNYAKFSFCINYAKFILFNTWFVLKRQCIFNDMICLISCLQILLFMLGIDL